MAKRYAIWDKKSDVITATGQVFSAEQWMQKYPMYRLDHIVAVCAAGEINGAYAGTLGNLVQVYSARGADFAACETDEDKLGVIEAFEDAAQTTSTEPTAEERIAAALEYQVMASLPDKT